MKPLRGIELKRFRKQLDKPQIEIVLLLENIQYARNVASLFRTADAAGIRDIILTGISKQPPFGKELQKVSRKKEQSIRWKYYESTGKAIASLKKKGYHIAALELTETSVPADKFANDLKAKKLVIVAGSEVYGVTRSTLDKCDSYIYLPMYGKGASLNVSTSAAVLIYYLLLSTKK